jgi:hypothetical protein
MKKYIKYIIMIILFIFLMSCSIFNGKVVGSFIEVTVTGTYYNEVTGEMTTEEEELKAIVNLYALDKGTKAQDGGYFPGGGGIVYSSSSGFDTSAPTISGSGTAHVNGFIAKGPYSIGSVVSIALIDEDMNRIEIGSEFIDQLKTETDSLSEFSIDLPATEDANIEINLNALSFLQTERMYELIENQGLSFYEAYVQSKEEILLLVNLENGIKDFKDFEKMDLRRDNESNSVMLLANSILAGTDPVTKQGGSLLQNVLQQIKENGAIIDESIGDLIADNLANLNINEILQNLSDFFGGGVELPQPQDFMDDDNDGVVNRFDAELVNPVGEILTEDTGNPPDGSFKWTRVSTPDGVGRKVGYRLQLSANPYFDPQYTAEVDLPPDSGAGNYYTFDAIDVSNFVADEVYYWRVKALVLVPTGIDDFEIIDKSWSGSTSFIPRLYLDSSAPTGTISALNGVTLPTRQVIIDNTQIIGADTMSFNIVGYPDLSIDNVPYELFRRILLPTDGGSGPESFIIEATFSNNAGTLPTQTLNVTVNTAQNPNGSFIINKDSNETINPKVMLDLSDISYAYKMRFSNDGNNFSNWVPFRTKFPWVLFDSPGDQTVSAEFANSYGFNIQDITADINLVNTNMINLTISDDFRVIVGHDLDSDQNYDFENSDIQKLYLPTSVYNNTPHQIRFKPETTVYFKILQNDGGSSGPSWSGSDADLPEEDTDYDGVGYVYYIGTMPAYDINLEID